MSKDETKHKHEYTDRQTAEKELLVVGNMVVKWDDLFLRRMESLVYGEMADRGIRPSREEREAGSGAPASRSGGVLMTLEEAHDLADEGEHVGIRNVWIAAIHGPKVAAAAVASSAGDDSSLAASLVRRVENATSLSDMSLNFMKLRVDKRTRDGKGIGRLVVGHGPEKGKQAKEMGEVLEAISGGRREPIVSMPVIARVDGLLPKDQRGRSQRLFAAGIMEAKVGDWTFFSDYPNMIDGVDLLGSGGDEKYAVRWLGQQSGEAVFTEMGGTMEFPAALRAAKAALKRRELMMVKAARAGLGVQI